MKNKNDDASAVFITNTSKDQKHSKKLPGKDSKGNPEGIEPQGVTANRPDAAQRKAQTLDEVSSKDSSRATETDPQLAELVWAWESGLLLPGDRRKIMAVVRKCLGGAGKE